MHTTPADASERLLDIALAEIAGGRRAPDVRARVLALLQGSSLPAPLARRTSPRLLAAALMLLGAAAVCAVALHGPADRAAQDPSDPQSVLEALRADIARQEQSVKVLAWSAASRHTSGTGKDQRRGGELRARVVCEARPNGRAHVWFEPRTLPWQDHDKFVREVGESVHARADAMLIRESATEGEAGGARPQGMILGVNDAYGLVNEAGGCASLWLRPGRQVRWLGDGVSTSLRAARAENVRLSANAVEVHVPRGSGNATTYRFARRDEKFSLAERREATAGMVTSYTVVEDVCIDGKVWFPRRIRVERLQLDRPWAIDIEISDVKLDPPLAEGTFTIVAPAKTHFSTADPDQRLMLTEQTPVLQGIVRLETADTKRPEPPTAPHPEKR